MKVEFWTTSGGKCPVLDFISAEPPESGQRLLKSIEYLEAQGINLLSNRQKFEKLRGYENLYELKIRFKGTAYRILCSIVNGVAWLLHAFKKSHGAPLNQFKIAQGRSKKI